jgi:Mn2+/Fe2+ NRAMP family transporter
LRYLLGILGPGLVTGAADDDPSATITPYMFFWQTSQEVEENKGRTTRRSLRDLRTDNAVGMLISQAVAWFIIITAATVLHTAHVTTINTAADAAKALEPLVKTFPHSGQIAQALFAIGIVSLGMLAIPVMAASTNLMAQRNLLAAADAAKRYPDRARLRSGDQRRDHRGRRRVAHRGLATA